MKHTKHHLSRRDFLKRTATVSLGTLAAGALAPTAVQAQETVPIPPHGSELRGMTLPIKDPTAEGRFGFMLKGLPPSTPPDDPMEMVDLIKKEPLRALGSAMQEWLSSSADFDENDRWNENPNPDMTAGVTFLGQFIDHDITFDSTPLSEQLADPDAITSFRTPRYDLDSLYGRGPNDPDHQQFYDPKDRNKFLIIQRTEPDPLNPGHYVVVEDLPRDANGKAIIADPRNDQTMIIAQLHLAFMKFHNKLVDYCRALRVPAASVFESARRLARWHYQWLVIHDFLPRIVGPAMANAVYKEVAGKPPVITMHYYKPTNKNDRAFIPVEFSVAAYRFGHSIARPRYTISEFPGLPKVNKIALFADDSVASDAKLNGSRPIPAKLRIQWSRFFNAPGQYLSKRTRQIDARLSLPLFTLPSTALPDTNSEALLAVRNLQRGRRLQLPSGQEVAQRMGITPLTNAQLARRYRLKLNKDTFAFIEEHDEADAELGPVITHPVWNGAAPLWFYILKEAELEKVPVQQMGPDGKPLVGPDGKPVVAARGGARLGPVGGRIVTESLVGMLQRDRNSYLYLNASWKPVAPIAPTKGQFTMVDLLKYAGVWS